VSVRCVAASNKDIKEETARGRFRRDLYYRISTFTITVPPFAERREEIPAFIEHFGCRTRGIGGSRSAPRRSRCSARTPGRGTSGNCRTSSTARCCSPRAMSCASGPAAGSRLAPGGADETAGRRGAVAHPRRPAGVRRPAREGGGDPRHRSEDPLPQARGLSGQDVKISRAISSSLFGLLLLVGAGAGTSTSTTR